MEARYLRALLLAAAFFSLGAGRPYYSARSPHFIVSAPTAQLAEEICQAAEQYRRDLAIEWLGHELPAWHSPCPIRADVAANLGAGGATSFVFAGGAPTQWTMQIQGSRERILDSVLPHEITHTIFATHFGRPLPRWADEGACTTVEHASEKAKQDKFLLQFLTASPPRSIPFNRMFAMKDYPPDILPLYSQGYSLARFLIHQGGKHKFVQYVGEGMRTNHWPAATQKFYGFGSLSDLQLTWVEWVRQGSPTIDASAAPTTLIAATQPPTTQPPTNQPPTNQPPTNLLPTARNIGNTQMASLTQQPQVRTPDGARSSWQTVQEQNARAFAEINQIETPQPVARPAITPIEPAAAESNSTSRPVSGGWYARRRDQAQATRSPAAGQPTGVNLPPTPAQPATEAHPTVLQTRPKVIQAEPLTPAASGPAASGPAASAPDRRVLLEWTRSSDQPYRRSADLTGVALRDTGTILR